VADDGGVVAGREETLETAAGLPDRPRAAEASAAEVMDVDTGRG
jgi:hypothetical protein